MMSVQGKTVAQCHTNAGTKKMEGAHAHVHVGVD